MCMCVIIRYNIKYYVYFERLLFMSQERGKCVVGTFFALTRLSSHDTVIAYKYNVYM